MRLLITRHVSLLFQKETTFSSSVLSRHDWVCENKRRNVDGLREAAVWSRRSSLNGIPQKSAETQDYGIACGWWSCREKNFHKQQLGPTKNSWSSVALVLCLQGNTNCFLVMHTFAKKSHLEQNSLDKCVFETPQPKKSKRIC